MPTLSDTFINTVLEQCAALKSAGVWLPEPTIRPRAWLENFEEQERLAAAALLDHFVFFSDRLADLLFEASFDALGRTFWQAAVEPKTTTAQFRALLGEAYITRVEGEKPNPTDSGYLYCRKVRQLMRVNEDRIVDPAKALEHALSGAPVIFVDDFVGSGDQMLKTWTRSYGPSSFADVHRQRPFPATYLCMVSTEHGIRMVESNSPVRVFAAHVLGPRFSLPGFTYSPQLPSDIAQRVNQLLIKYAPLLELDQYMRQDDFPVFGYKRLSVAVGFQHSVPDATLPLFWARGGRDWTPLVERR